MTTNHDWVYEWLSAIPASTVAPDKGNQQQQQNKERPGETSQQATPKLETLATGAGNRKRRRYFPSPPMSAERVSQDYAEGGDNDEYESSNEQGDGHRHAKRPRQFPDDLDATPTRPTPGLLKRPNSTTTSSLSSARSSTSTSSHLKRGRRGNISPTKGMAALRIEHIIDKRSFTDQQSLQSLPPSLKDMVRLIRRDAAGLGIVSSPDMVSSKTILLDDSPSLCTLLTHSWALYRQSCHSTPTPKSFFKTCSIHSQISLTRPAKERNWELSHPLPKSIEYWTRREHAFLKAILKHLGTALCIIHCSMPLLGRQG